MRVDKNKGEIVPGLFPETQEKRALRARDGMLIQRLSQKKGRQLYYLGLAGVNARDVIAWEKSLDQVTVVERPITDSDLRAQFETDVLLKLTPLFNGHINVVFQDIWNYLISDEFNAQPRFPDLFNLDFCGGLINHVDMEYPVQRESFQSLFNRGQKCSADFLLLCTLLPRDKGKTTYKKYLGDYVEALKTSSGSRYTKTLTDQLDVNLHFHERSNLSLFKACLPILLEDIGRSHNYKVTVAYTRLYTKMIHFAFECTFVPGVLGLAPDFTAVVRILNAPLRKLLSDGQEQQTWPPRIDS